MKTNLLIRFGLIAALAVAAIAHGTSQNEPGAFDRFEKSDTYDLTYDDAAGERYIVDTGLSQDDCFAAMWSDDNHAKKGFGCEATGYSGTFANR